MHVGRLDSLEAHRESFFCHQERVCEEERRLRFGYIAVGAAILAALSYLVGPHWLHHILGRGALAVLLISTVAYVVNARNKYQAEKAATKLAWDKCTNSGDEPQ